MESHWNRIFFNICLFEVTDLRINSYLYHGKTLTVQQNKRVEKRLQELEPYFDSFMKDRDDEETYKMGIEEVRVLFSEHLKLCRKGEKIKKVMENIKNKK